MRFAMARAPVGDDVYGEDPTVNALQRRVAALLGKEAALFFPTGTMANLAALAAHTWGHRGAEVVVGEPSHIFNWEANGASTLLGAALRPVPLSPIDGDGCLDGAAVARALKRWGGDHEHCARPAAVCVENPQSDAGGLPIPPEALAAQFHERNKFNRIRTLNHA